MLSKLGHPAPVTPEHLQCMLNTTSFASALAIITTRSLHITSHLSSQMMIGAHGWNQKNLCAAFAAVVLAFFAGS